MLGANSEDYVLPREGESALANCRGQTVRQGEPCGILAFDPSLQEIHGGRTKERRDERVGGSIVKLKRGPTCSTRPPFMTTILSPMVIAST